MPMRAELQARMRALEAERDRLEEQMAARRRDRASAPTSPAPDVDPARMLRAVEGILETATPSMKIMTEALGLLVSERADAERRNDAEGVEQASRLQDELNASVHRFAETIDLLQETADRLRTDMAQGES